MVMYLVIYLVCIIIVEAFLIYTYNEELDKEHGVTGWTYFYVCLFSPAVILYFWAVYLSINKRG